MLQFAIVVAFLLVPGLYHHYGIPFRLSKIHVDWPSEPAWEIGQEPVEIASILEEPFTFLGKGVQSFAFLSKDGNYVLKCFRFDHCPIPHVKRFVHWMKMKMGKRQRKENRPDQIFQACKMTFDQLQEETGLVWIHLNPKPGKKIKVVDGFGKPHWIDPAQTRFVLQKRAIKLMDAWQAASPVEREKILESFVLLLKSLEEKGIATTDWKLKSNFGFRDGKAVQIDFADNVYDPIRAHKNTEHFIDRFRSKTT